MAAKPKEKIANGAPAAKPGSVMPTSAEMRASVYVIMSAACGSADPMVRRVLAGQAFTLAQQAQMRSWIEAGTP